MQEIIINAVISKMSDFLQKQNFKKLENGRYSNDKLDFSLEYNENSKHITLNIGSADAESLTQVSEWMCDSETVESDAGIIADDFTETLMKKLGIKKSALTFNGTVTIPVKDKSGNDMTIEGFTAKFLNAFPEYKEYYKEEVAKHGEYLYVDFMKKTAVAKLREFAKSPDHNIKSIEKVLSIACEAYYDGTEEASNLAVGFVVPAAFYDCPEVFEKCSQKLKETKPLFVTACKTTIEHAAKNKKFLAVIQ